MTQLIHTVTDCNPECINPRHSMNKRYKLRNYLFDTEQDARDFMASNRPQGPLGFTYCFQRWGTPYSFDNFLHTDYRKERNQ